MKSRDECEAQVKGFLGAKYRKFMDVEEAEAFAGAAVRSSPERRSQSPVKAAPSTTTTPRRASPYRRPEPAPETTPATPRIHRASRSKKPTRIASLSPTRTLPRNPAADWTQRAASPDITDESTWDVVYSDGACRGNGKPGSVAGIGVWWGRNDPRYVLIISFMRAVEMILSCPGIWQNDVPVLKQIIEQS